MHLTLLRPENREFGNFVWAIEGRWISWCCCGRSVTSNHICWWSKEGAEQLFVLCRPHIYYLATISCFVFRVLLVLFATRTIMFVFISLKYGLFLCNLPFFSQWFNILNRVHRANDEELKGMREESANVKHAAVSHLSVLQAQSALLSLWIIEHASVNLLLTSPFSVFREPSMWPWSSPALLEE